MCKSRFDPHENEKRDHEFSCYCGHSFNSLRGLNTHRRTCFVGLLIEIVNHAIYKNDEITDYKDLPKGLKKRGVIVSNGVQEWERANKYFRDHLYHNNKVKNVNKKINDVKNKIYEYFSDTHGQVKDKEINEYENWTKNQLKIHLKLLKSQNLKPVEEIKRVSRVLRKRYK